MRKTIITLILSIILIIPSYAQVKRTNNWYFGLNAGLEFNSNYPKVLTDGNIVTGGGSAIMSDTSGNLMFYSDGENVWNKNHDLMPNAQGLLGLNGSTQPALIIPIPENDTLLYLFTTDGINSGLTFGLRYSIINMNLDNGLGDITSTKNVKLLQPVSQKISAVYHSNGIDIWLVTHHWGSDTFYSYKITSSGISQPVLSGVGTYHTGSHANSTGHLKLSPDGNKIAVTSQNKGILEIFDFDNSTGVVSNQIQFNFPIVHGIEFSPSSSLLYVSTLSASEIFQINLNAGSDSAIKKSLLKIGEAKKEPPMGQDYGLGSLQLASDGKIYCATAQIGSYFLDVILQPDSLGENCRFKNQYVFLNGKTSFFGFPNFFRSYFNNMPTANFPKLSGEIKMSHSTTNHGKVYLYSAYKNYSFRLFDSTTFEMKNNGTFEFPFMNDAQYKMIAVLDSNSTDYNNYYSTWYGDELDSANALTFTAPGSYTINLISTPNISGTVYSANGSFGKVYLYQINSSNQYSLIDSTTFDSSGYYRFPYLNSGNYLLHAVLNQNSPNYSDYAPTYYVDVVHWAYATKVNSTGSNYDIYMYNINTPAAGPGSISGKTVKKVGSNDYKNVPNALVMLLDGSENVVAYQYSGNYGEFEFAKLPFGSYKIHVELTGIATYDLALELNADKAIYTDLIIQLNSTNSIFENDQDKLYIIGLPNPNPFDKYLKLPLFSYRNTEIAVELRNMLGQVIYRSETTIRSGSNIIELSTNISKAGIYILTIQDLSTGVNKLNYKLVKN